MATTASRVLQKLLKGPIFVRPTEPEWLAWAMAVGRSLGMLADDPQMRSRKTLTGPIVHRTSRLPLAWIVDLPPAHRPIEARYLSIGQALRLFFLSAEPAAEFARTVRDKWPDAWTIGYLGDVFGYLPTNAQIAEGGYEVDGFRELFALSGRFIRRNDEALAELLARI
jgi:hypothetical protein